MSVAVYVMPLSTWLEGRFRTVWGPDGAGGGPSGRERSPDEVRAALDAFGESLDRVLAFRPEWDEAGPARSATIFSLDGFALPFQLAQRWAYKLKLPRLCALEPPQIWLPAEFEPTLRLAAPWKPESEVTVASSSGVQEELGRLLTAIQGEERPDLDETERVARRLCESAAQGLEHQSPVIVEG